MKAERQKVRWGLLVLLFLVLGADAGVACWFLMENWHLLGRLAWIYLGIFTTLAVLLIVHIDRAARPRDEGAAELLEIERERGEGGEA